MSLKKVLIISYYWPPSGGSGVQRWLKFVKYLPEFGIEPHVYTPLNPDFNIQDKELLKEIPKEAVVIKKKIIEPYGFYRAFMGNKNSNVNLGEIGAKNDKSFKNKITKWIRGNIFIPDPRILWRKPSIKFLKNYIVENNIDTIISTGPPHSMHLIALGLKKDNPKLSWIADFRDHWTNIGYFDELSLTKASKSKYFKLEKEVLLTADTVLAIGKTFAEELSVIGAKNVKVITNGYDENQYLNQSVERSQDKFIVSYIGLLSSIRNPEEFWEAIVMSLKEIEGFDKKLIIRLVGKVDETVKKSIENHGLNDFVEYLGMVSHSEAVKFQLSADLLLLLIDKSANAKGILTGKFFEYMSSQRPILAIGPIDGDVAEMLAETNSGGIYDYEDINGIIKSLKSSFELFKEGKLETNSNSFSKYSRRELTRELSKIILA